jgi:hypothetical protein
MYTTSKFAPKPRALEVLFCLLAKEARTKEGECAVLFVKAAAHGAARCASQVTRPWSQGRYPRHRSLCVADT